MGEPHRPADRSEHGEPGFRDGTMHPLHRLYVAVGCEPNAASKTDDYRPFSPWGHGSALHGICPPPAPLRSSLCYRLTMPHRVEASARRFPDDSWLAFSSG